MKIFWCMGRHAKHRGINHRVLTPQRIFHSHIMSIAVGLKESASTYFRICWTPFSGMILFVGNSCTYQVVYTDKWIFSRIITEPPFIILAGGEMPSAHYTKGENNYEYDSNYNI